MDTSCLQSTELAGWVAGTLPAPDRRRAVIHIGDCEVCRQAVSALAQLDSTDPGQSGDAAPGACRGHAIDAIDDYPQLVAVDADHYVIDKEIARGGMGRILLARDRRLGRTVAIKELLLTSGNLRARFEREARITAKLQHPGIVNVLEAGAWRSGEPFYAMKLVSGTTLDKVIAECSTLESRLAHLPNVIAVADALAFAHNRRVIHRDLKPANVLVGEFGETVVIDWGLAKDLDDPRDTDLGSGELIFAQPSELTVEGSVIGTPAYMPPEQAAGRSVDERADVYALGAMLYHLLVGNAPYVGNTKEILAAVAAAPPPSVRDCTTGAPLDLIAIVEKAMARDAADRYATAKQLADDLKKFQTGQLVGAHRYSTWQLIGRWIRKNRIAVAVAGVAAALLVVLGIVSIQRILDEQANAEHERELAEHQRAVADQQRQAAETSQRNAEELMSFMLGDLSTKLEPIGKLELLESVASKARSYYAQRPSAPTTIDRGLRIDTLLGVGRVFTHNGNLSAALATYQAAAAAAHELAAVDGNSKALEREARSHDAAGSLIAHMGDTAAAITELNTSLPIWERIIAREPSDATLQTSLATSLITLGDVQITDGKAPDALTAYRRALQIAERVTADHPDDLVIRRVMSMVRQRIANILLDQGDRRRALDEYRSSLEISKGLAAAQSGNATVRFEVALGHTKIGRVLLDQGDRKSAIAEFRASIAICAALVRQDPTIAHWEETLSDNYTLVGDVELEQHHAANALIDYRRALGIYKKQADLDPKNGAARHKVAVGEISVAGALRALGDRPGALASYRRGLAILDKLVADDPSHVTWLRWAADGYRRLGDLATDRRDDAGALDAYRQSRSHLERLGAKDSQNPEDQGLCIEVELAIAKLLEHRGDPRRARASYEAALTTAEKLAARDPSNRDWAATLAEARGHLRSCCQIRRRTR